MTSQLTALSIDAHHPLRLAHFWAALLRWEVAAPTAVEAGAIALVPTDGTAFTLRFRSAPGQPVHPSRIHLDLTTATQADQDETVKQALALGGRHLDIGQDPDDGHVVLADPEGNEFCVIEPGNTFLGDCGRLGAVNCDGSQATGYFWSDALGWPLIWDQDEETAIRATDPTTATGLTGPIISWGGSPVNPKGTAKNRLQLELTPAAGSDHQAELDRLLSLGATRTDSEGDALRVELADPDDNEFRFVRVAP